MFGSVPLCDDAVAHQLMNLWKDKNFPIIVSCAKTLAPWTEKEIRSFGYDPIDKSENYVVIRGALRDVFKLNLWLRTAQRVLVPLFRGRCRHVRELYDKKALFPDCWIIKFEK